MTRFDSLPFAGRRVLRGRVRGPVRDVLGQHRGLPAPGLPRGRRGGGRAVPGRQGRVRLKNLAALR